MVERSSARRLLVVRNSVLGEPGDVEVGECAEDATGRRGFVKSIEGDTAVLTGRLWFQNNRQTRHAARGS